MADGFIKYLSNPGPDLVVGIEVKRTLEIEMNGTDVSTLMELGLGISETLQSINLDLGALVRKAAPMPVSNAQLQVVIRPELQSAIDLLDNPFANDLNEMAARIETISEEASRESK